MKRASTAAWLLFAIASVMALPTRSQPPSPGVTVAATGDLLLHIKVGRAARAHPEGWAHVFGGLAASVRPGDIAFANLETPLVEDLREVRTGTPPTLGAPPEVAVALARAGLDVLGCANNHAYDQGALGLHRTLASVEAAGVVAVGAGASQSSARAHRILERDGVRTAFLSYTTTMNRGPGGRDPMAHVARVESEDALDQSIAMARADADVVVLAVHWGHDFQARPSARQRRLARRWVEAGVDLILGTGPHILHPVEVATSPRGRAIVAYSLGNAVSNQGKRYRIGRTPPEGGHPALLLPTSRDGIMLRARLEVPRRGSVEVASLRGVPLWTENNFWALQQRRTRHFDIHSARLSELDESTQLDRRPAIAAALGPAVDLIP